MLNVEGNLPGAAELGDELFIAVRLATTEMEIAMQGYGPIAQTV